MQRGDARRICELAGRIWRECYLPDIVSAGQIDYMLEKFCTAEAIEKAAAEKQQRFWLLHEGERLCGYIAVEPAGEDNWFIDKLYVDACDHGKGFGARLLAHAIAAHAPRVLTLRVNRRNVQAVNFYFRNGFIIERLDVRDIGGGYVMDDFIMKRVL